MTYGIEGLRQQGNEVKGYHGYVIWLRLVEEGCAVRGWWLPWHGIEDEGYAVRGW